MYLINILDICKELCYDLVTKETICCIKERRSTRKYTSQKINKKTQELLLNAAICAPFGKNGRPWRFKCIDDARLIKDISQLSIYRTWMHIAPLFQSLEIRQLRV